MVAFTGFLSSYEGVLELDADTTDNPATGYTVLSNNIAALPAPKFIAWDSLATNNNANFEYNVEGSLVILTNVYFTTNVGFVTTAVNVNCQVTNASGKIGYVYLYAGQDNDLTNQTIPAFAYAVVGPLNQATNVHAGYQVTPTRWEDIVTNPLPAISLDTPTGGSSFTAPANITLGSTVTSNNYPISYVGFYNGASLIANVTNPPYSYSWNGVAAGSNALSAQAFYALNGINTSVSSRSTTLSSPTSRRSSR